MSVIVKNMEMPKNCGECPFIFSSWGIEYYCHLAESSTSAEYVGREKMTNCPLIELPPHSDLVDRNKLLAEYDRQHKGPAGGARRIMEQADAVIEAEGETE